MEQMITRVTSEADIAAVVKLACEIWHQHFVPIIGVQQVDYMLDRFQSAAAIAEQIQGGAEYYVAAADNRHLGYMGLIPDQSAGRMMLSKLYVKRDARGSGIGSRLLEFALMECNQGDMGTIWLTVNRFNHVPINWYHHKGFVVVNEVRKDIGEGFYMDDFIMEKKLLSGTGR